MECRQELLELDETAVSNLDNVVTVTLDPSVFVLSLDESDQKCLTADC